MKPDTLHAFHGHFSSFACNESKLAGYKRLLYPKPKCYFYLWDKQELWPEAYLRVLQEHGLILLKVDDQQSLLAVQQALASRLPLQLAVQCSRSAHSGESPAAYTLVNAQQAADRSVAVLWDCREVIAQLSFPAFEALSNTCVHSGEQAVPMISADGESLFFPAVRCYQQQSSASVAAINELRQCLQLADYAQHVALQPGVMLIVNNRRFLYAML